MNAQIKEFRIGNYIQIKNILHDEVYYEIARIHKDSVWVYILVKFKQIPIDLKIVSNIPITNEWLQKLGFNETDGVFVHEKRVPYYIELFNGSYALKNGNGSFAKPVTHIHMLQNIWYFLTGTELTLKR